MKHILLAMVLCFGIAAVQAQEVYNSTGKSGKAHYRENAKKTGFDVNKLVIGGGVGGGFGSGILSFQIAPIIGYRITDRFAAGVGLSYQYVRLKNYRVLQDYTTGEVFYKSPNASIIAPSVWARYFVFDRLFVSAIGEYSFTNQTDFAWAQSGGMNIEKVKLHYGIPCLLLGVGYAQPITNNASFVLMASYDVLQSSTIRDVNDSRGNGPYEVKSPYYGTIDFRVGFNIGF